MFYPSVVADQFMRECVSIRYGISPELAADDFEKLGYGNLVAAGLGGVAGAAMTSDSKNLGKNILIGSLMGLGGRAGLKEMGRKGLSKSRTMGAAADDIGNVPWRTEPIVGKAPPKQLPVLRQDTSARGNVQFWQDGRKVPPPQQTKAAPSTPQNITTWDVGTQKIIPYKPQANIKDVTTGVARNKVPPWRDVQFTSIKRNYIPPQYLPSQKPVQIWRDGKKVTPRQEFLNRLNDDTWAKTPEGRRMLSQFHAPPPTKTTASPKPVQVFQDGKNVTPRPVPASKAGGSNTAFARSDDSIIPTVKLSPAPKSSPKPPPTKTTANPKPDSEDLGGFREAARREANHTRQIDGRDVEDMVDKLRFSIHALGAKKPGILMGSKVRNKWKTSRKYYHGASVDDRKKALNILRNPQAHGGNELALGRAVMILEESSKKGLQKIKMDRIKRAIIGTGIAGGAVAGGAILADAAQVKE